MWCKNTVLSSTMKKHGDGHALGMQGIQVDDDFDLHMIQICKPEKAAKSLSGNPERAILMPKYIMTFTKGATTQVLFLRFSGEDITAMVDGAVFPERLAESYAQTIKMVDEAQ